MKPGQFSGLGVEIHKRDSLALETQPYPDSPNRSAFPTTMLRPGERFSSATIFRFSQLS